MGLLFIFIDGFGIPERRGQYSDYMSFERIVNHAIPIDACCGVEGIPQSATGQATIFTGFNIQKLIGRHMEGFPDKAVRELVVKRNVFSELIKNNKKVGFINGYRHNSQEKIKNSKHHSVTTVMTFNSIGKVRTRDDLLIGNAVFHDITNETFDDEAIPLISPKQAFDNLKNIMKGLDFGVFEYFLTDYIGHGRLKETKERHLSNLDSFLNNILQCVDNGEFDLLLTSDHGNLENPDVKKHSINPVPLFYKGIKDINNLSNSKDITDIFKVVMEYFEIV